MYMYVCTYVCVHFICICVYFICSITCMYACMFIPQNPTTLCLQLKKCPPSAPSRKVLEVLMLGGCGGDSGVWEGIVGCGRGWASRVHPMLFDSELDMYLSSCITYRVL